MYAIRSYYETGGDLVGNQQNLIAIAQCPGLAQILGMVKTHATGALNDGLKDQGGDLLMLCCQQLFQRGHVAGIPGAVEACLRCRYKVMLVITSYSIHYTKLYDPPGSRTPCRRS